MVFRINILVDSFIPVFPFAWDKAYENITTYQEIKIVISIGNHTRTNTIMDGVLSKLSKIAESWSDREGNLEKKIDPLL